MLDIMCNIKWENYSYKVVNGTVINYLFIAII